MAATLNKQLNFSFGANNFTSSKPSNGTYLRLILTSLSKKGNWGSLFRKFLNLSIESRKLSTIQSNLLPGSKELFFSPTPYSDCNSNKPTSLNLNKATQILTNSPLSTFEIKRNKNKFPVFLFLGKSTVSKEKILPSLRSIYSLFHPILVSIELKSKRRGGRVFSVPVPVKSDKRRHSIFIRWFKQSLLEQTGSPLDKFLVNELHQLSLRAGKSMDRLSELDKTIKLNRVFLRKSQIKLV